MIRPLTQAQLEALQSLNYDILVFENYGFDVDKKAVILVTPFFERQEANRFFDDSKRSYNLIKIKDFKAADLLNRYHFSLFIDVPEIVISRWT